MNLFEARAEVLQANRRTLAERLHIDTPLLLCLLTLAAISLFVLYSASGQKIDVIWRQSLRLGVGFMIMLILAQFNPASLKRWTPWLFTLGIGLLLAVLFFGETGKGAQRWLDLGAFRFQPSEMLKLAVPMMVAWYLSDHPLPPNLGRLAIASLIIIVPTLLIAKQPDLGTALLVAGAGIFVLLFAGISWRLIFASMAAMARRYVPYRCTRGAGGTDWSAESSTIESASRTARCGRSSGPGSTCFTPASAKPDTAFPAARRGGLSWRAHSIPVPISSLPTNPPPILMTRRPMPSSTDCSPTSSASRTCVMPSWQ